jgi:predicted permease
VIRLAATAVHRLLQRAYPREFRRHFGREMGEVFSRRIASAEIQGRWPAIRLAAWLLAGEAASGIAERWHRLVRRPRPSASDSLNFRSKPMSWESIVADLRLTLRQLRRAPVFATVTILTLGLGIGASTAIFSVAHAVLLRPLPYEQPGRLVAVWSNNTRQNEPRNPVSPGNYQAIRADTTAFAGVEAMYSFLTNVQIEINGSREMFTASTVTPGMFALLGRPALRGRGLQPGDDLGVVLSHGMWTRAFNADPDVVGKTVSMAGSPGPLTVVGVMPPDFIFPYKSMLGLGGFTRALSPDLWLYLPNTAASRMVDNGGQPIRNLHFLAVIARLKAGASLDTARAELGAIASRRAAQYPDSNEAWQITALGLQEQAVGRVRPAVLLLMGGVSVLLLVTCLNIANILLARASGRRRDLAVRAALGASARRLGQQSLIGSATLAVFGGAAGIVVAVLGQRIILALAPADLPRIAETRFDGVVIGFALVLSVLTGAIVGLLPMLATARSKTAALDETHRTTASLARRRTRSSVVVAEVALATLLCVGAVLMVRSFVAVLNVDPGFRSDSLLTFQQFVPPIHQTPAARIAFLDDFMARISALPGVVSVGGTTRIPLGSTQVTTMLGVEGRDVPAASLPEVDMRRSVGDYFQAMGMPTIAGRVFTPADRTSTEGLAVINSALAARVFPGENAIGRRVRMGPGPTAVWLTIIGIVGDIRHSSLEEAPRPEIYISYLQGPPSSPFFVVRASGDPSSLASGIRQISRDIGADPPFGVQTMTALRAESVALRRFTVLLAGIFGLLAIVIAAVGIYGVTALGVAERRDEVGVRVALGATPSQIVWMIVGQAARLGLAGIAMGLAAGAVMAQVARSLLFGIGPSDAVTFIGVPVALFLVAIVAALVPALRATKISPVEAIRT